MKSISVHSVLALAFLVALPTWAAERPAEKDKALEAKGPVDLEARLLALEQRVKELEAELAEDDAMDFRVGPPMAGDLDEMWERFRGQLEREYGMRGPQFGLPPMQAPQRPRLGIEMAPITEELAERFKNNVKDGAFVMRVLPNSPADKAGLRRGDVITAFNGKPISSPQDLAAAVRQADKGKQEVVISRRGDSQTFNIDLGLESPQEATMPDEGFGSGWMRGYGARELERGDDKTKTEIRASAFELNDELAKKLNLSDDQRKRMGDVLNKQAKALTEEVGAQVLTDTTRGGFSIGMSSDLNKAMARRLAETEKELAGVLNPEQLKQWKEHVSAHSSFSMSYSRTFQDSGKDEPGSKTKNF